MKTFSAISVIAALSVSAASADPLFDPSFTGTSVPSGFTEVDANGGSVTYSPGDMVSSDFSVGGAEAYITATSATGAASFTTQLTFTPNYTADTADFGYPNPGTNAGVTLLDLFPQAGSNRPILEITFNANQYNHNSSVDVGGDIAYGNSTTAGTSEFAVPPDANSLSGVPVTLSLTTILTNLGADPSISGNSIWQIADVGTITDGTTTTPIDLTITGSAGSGYDPITSALKLDAGIAPGTYGGGAGPGADGFLASGATIDISDLSINTTPEPSTLALMFGGLGALALIVRRRLAA